MGRPGPRCASSMVMLDSARRGVRVPPLARWRFTRANVGRNLAVADTMPGVVISPADHALQRTPTGAERSLRINSSLRVI
jgi:hypothetical protein